MRAGGFVLAGGKSSRMGQNKALIYFAGEPLIARALRSLREVCTEVAISGAGLELEEFGRCVADVKLGCGPLGGIVSALEETTYKWNLFLAVDMPFVPKIVWLRLLERAEGSNLAGVVARVAERVEDGSKDGTKKDVGNGGDEAAEERVQPLCAVYSRRTLEALRGELNAGRWRVLDAVQAAGAVEYVDFKNGGWFRNLNTPEDLEQATIRLEEEKDT